MKKIISLLSIVISLQGFSQSKIYLRGDSIFLQRDGGNATLIIRNSTRDTIGFLFNNGHGVTRFKRAVVTLNDSTFVIGGDTLRIHTSVAAGGTAWGTITGTLSAQTDLLTALNLKQNQLNGTGFVKASGTTITYDNSTYLTSIDTTNIANFSTKVHSLFSATAPITYNSGTGRIAITQATTSTDGYLSSTDWNTFNNKGGSTTTADSTLIATGGQTAFTFTAVPGAYTDYIIFVNGASIEPITYFTTSSNTITFSIGLVVGDRVRYKRIK